MSEGADDLNTFPELPDIQDDGFEGVGEVVSKPAPQEPPRRSYADQTFVGKLSEEDRDTINRLLDCGDSPRKIVITLCASIPTLRVHHIRKWKETGYKDWVTQREKGLDPAQAARLIEKGEAYKLHELNLFVAAQQINGVIAKVDMAHVLEAAKTSPRYYLALLRQATQLLLPAIAAEKYKDHVRDRKKAIQQELAAAKATGGISEEALAKIERELRLF